MNQPGQPRDHSPSPRPDLLAEQYNLVRLTRKSLLQMLAAMSQEDLHTEVPGFGHGTIARTHVHAADCYLFWLGTFPGLRVESAFVPEECIPSLTVADLESRWEEVDRTVERFLGVYRDRWLEPVRGIPPWQASPVSLTPLWLLTHAITHEFHHKGQVVSMARRLGHVPPDTDLVVE